ncbi:MAG: amidase [Ectothiorhodospiraceae bacterium]|nr:amidase [Ectothiorhodospiraceae bacterium]
MTDLCDLGAIALRRMIGARQVSPRELLAACKARIEALNPTFNAITATCWERAQREAEAAERAVGEGAPLGPLHGLPIGIKDTQVTGGLRTTFGSPIFADNVPAADERMVAAVRAAGAIVIGKTNVPEFGAGANTTNPVYGATGNPLDPKRICGGSSGGSAVALATRMLPLATGSDTGGSLRTPAALCGIVGLRPSPGLVPMKTKSVGWSPISVHGPLGRDVAEAALMLSVIAASDADDPLSYPVDAAALATPPRVDPSRLRVAVSEDLGFAPVDQMVRRCFRRAVERITPHVAVVEPRDPDLHDADDVFETLRAIQFLAGHEKHYREQRDLLGPNLVENVEQAMGYTFADVVRAHTAHTALYRRFIAFMADWDVLITPSVTVPPFPLEQLYPPAIDGVPARTYFHWLALAYGITLTTHPAISIPCGLDEQGTPFGIQIVGKRGGDHALLGVAAALEALLG